MVTTCHLCGRYGETETHHMLHGSMRKLADEDGLTVQLCPACHRRLHDLGSYDKILQVEAEQRWLLQDSNRTKADFIKRYGKNFL